MDIIHGYGIISARDNTNISEVSKAFSGGGDAVSNADYSWSHVSDYGPLQEYATQGAETAVAGVSGVSPTAYLSDLVGENPMNRQPFDFMAYATSDNYFANSAAI